MDEKNTKINYYQKSQIEIDKIVSEGKRPTISLHACCGPCSTYPLEFLAPFFDITILYPNSNIYPSEEFYKRLEVDYPLTKNKKCAIKAHFLFICFILM